MSNIEHDMSQTIKPQTRGSEVVEFGSSNEVAAKPKRKPRKLKHLTVQIIHVF